MLEKLKELGVETDKILKTLNGKQALYERLIFKFYDMVLKSDMREDNLEDIFERTHALKGAAGNLGITPLFDAYVNILNYIRAEEMDAVPGAIAEMLPIQAKIMACIEEFKQ